MRLSARIAIGLSLLFVALVAAIAILAAANRNLSISFLSFMFPYTAFFVVGAVVMALRPSNSIGGLFAGVGLLAVAGWAAQEYAEYGLVTRPGEVPGALAAAWFAAWYWFPLLGSTIVFPLLLFPTGRPLSRRWRPLITLTALAGGLITILAALNPVLELQDTNVTVSNPVGVDSVGNVEESAVGSVLFVFLLASLVASFLSLVLRFKRARGAEREQLKWFTYAAALVGAEPLLDPLLTRLAFYRRIDDAVFGLLITLPPVAAGIAILKYRLYDIDRIINRTLVYGGLTAVLAGVYTLCVVVLPSALHVGQTSELLVAASTLLVAALFQPLRRRLQRFIDRRFYRSRYDAQLTVEEFGSRLRDEVRLDDVSTDLLGVVEGTLKPAHASLWLRPGAQR